MSLFGDPVPAVQAQSGVKHVRQAMLDSLAGLNASHQQTRVWAKVLYAPDIQALWYLRGDLMTLLAGLLGETAARAQLSIITDMFVGLLPAAQKSRPTRLGR